MTDDAGGVSSVEQDAWGAAWDVVRAEFVKAAPRVIGTMRPEEVKAFVAAMTDAMTSQAYAKAMDAKVAYEQARNLGQAAD